MSAPDAAPGIVVCDAGPLIHLDELESVDLLSIFGQVLVPDAVWTEVERHRPSALKSATPSWRRVSTDTLDPQAAALARALSLAAGEFEAICVCRAHPDAILLTDDAAARLGAESLGLRVHGTIGVLIRAVGSRRTVAETLTVLSDIPRRSSLHIRPALLAEIIDRVRGHEGR